jgi:phosphatidylethanolamine/phosphatidyl-N-methylethanolamine N-methyltransferase
MMEFARSPRSIGAVAPSSRRLAGRMLEGLNIPQASVVCEFGPGTGVFTEAILSELGSATRFFAVEKCPAMTASLRGRFPDLAVHNENILNISQLCRSQGIGGIDVIVCGLPWASFDAAFQAAALEATWNALNSGGRFVTFAYSIGAWLPAGRRFARAVRSRFSSVVTSPVVWANLPPAFVYRCVK